MILTHCVKVPYFKRYAYVWNLPDQGQIKKFHESHIYEVSMKI